jgi:uncharacterized protein (TIGR02246 family)
MRNWTLLAMLSLLTLACASVGSPQLPPSTAVDAFVSALVNADSDAIAAVFDENATVFMPFDSMPRRLEGREEIRRSFESFFVRVRASAPAPPYMKLNPLDLHTRRSGDTAIVTFHLGTVPPEGAKETSSFSRRTFVLQRKGGRWLVMHLHASQMRLGGE